MVREGQTLIQHFLNAPFRICAPFHRKKKLNTRFPLLLESLASPYPTPVAALYEKNRIFPLCHQFPRLLFMPTLSSLSQCTPPSLHPPFTVTWLHLMTGLTPAYRIKLISTKQGGRVGGRRRGRGGGVVAEERQQQGVRRKVQQEEGTIKSGPLGDWCWASCSAGCWGW